MSAMLPLKQSSMPLKNISNGHPFGYRGGLAFNKMKDSTCINIKHCMNVTEELHFKMRHLPFGRREKKKTASTGMRMKNPQQISLVIYFSSAKQNVTPDITASIL